MNERIDPNRHDDAALAEYLKGGSVVSQRYRETSNDEIPEDLDRRVLEMALASAADPKTRGRSRWVRWSAPLALAASAVLVVSILIESGVHEGEAPVAARQRVLQQAAEAPAAAADAEQAPREGQYSPGLSGLTHDTQATRPSAAPALARTEAEKAAQVAASARRAQQVLEQNAQTVGLEQQELAAAPPPEAPASAKPESAEAASESVVVTAQSRDAYAGVSHSPVAAIDDVDVSEVAVTGSRARRDAAGGSGPRNTVRSATTRRAEEPEAAAATRAPEAWLEEIRQLRRERRDRDADQEWDRFRKAHPEYVVADADPARPSK